MACIVMIAVLMILFWQHIPCSLGSSHWIVTEDGRIQSQVDTVFNMKRPYDLVAFMRQDDRVTMLDNLKDELLARKDEIDRNEDRDPGLEQRFYKTDPDCLAAGKPLPEFDLYISTVLPLENKGIKPEEHIDLNQEPPFHTPPDCTLFTELEYSVHGFEHLEGMKDRESLPGTPELGLKNAITYQDSVDEYGYRIYEALKRNKTSWVLYNMAAFYWRIKGDPYHVIECVRRALHYSPRLQKDVALISLANVLHRARYSNEAAIVVHAALDVSKELNVNHFTLGNIYAVLAEYNKSVICFENTLKIQPDFEAAAKRKHAVLCHAKLENALEEQHKSLQQTLNDLKDYQRKHDHWQQQKEKMNAEQVQDDARRSQHIAYDQYKMREAAVAMDEHCHLDYKDGKQVLTCTWEKKSQTVEMGFTHDSDNKPSSPSLEMEEESTKEKRSAVDYNRPVRTPTFARKKIDVPKYVQRENDWPLKDECDTYVKKVPDPRNLSTIYLSPDNKGFDVKPLLTEAQGLKPGGEHPLPWYPPVCVTLMDLPEGDRKTYDHIPSVSREQRAKMPLKLNDPSMRQTLLDHVNDGTVTEEEIGQRLLTSLQKKIGASWILYNLAGLYWRIIGNNYHGIECIRRSLAMVPKEYKDVPLVNLANILYKWGRFDDAIKLMKDALEVADYEPSSHFFYGNLLWATKNYTGAVKHYEKSLEQHPENNDVFNTLRALKCYQKYHQATQSVVKESSTTSNCPQRPAKNGPETESRVICKTENGEEKCVIETRSRGKAEDCNGHCTQTCTVTPIKFDSCTGDIEALAQAAAQSESQNSQKSSGGSNGEETLFAGGDISSKLDELSEHYLKKNLCQGEECAQLRLQQGGQKPHIKLDFVNGVLHQKLIFLQSPNDLPVEPHECVIFNDGSKSSGCNRPEYHAYLEDIEQNKENLQQLELFIMEHIHREPTCNKFKKEEVHRVWTQHECHHGNKDSEPCMDVHAATFSEQHCTSNKRAWEMVAADQLPEEELPDTRKHVDKRFVMNTPPRMECDRLEQVDFKAFTSTWLSVAAKGVNYRKHINFDTIIKRNLEEPECMTDFYSDSDVDQLPGIINKANLNYEPETGLRGVLQKLGDDTQAPEVMGTRIAIGLKKNITSWVLANLAALYWRVEGDAKKAIDCLRLSLTTAPKYAKDTSLISMANILHRAGYTNDAIMLTSMALDLSKDLVVGHFTVANLYAYKEKWDMATLFYESTLGLQSSFEPAKQRLRLIKCKMQRKDD